MRRVVPILFLFTLGCGVFDGSDSKESAAIVKAEKLLKHAQSYSSRHDGERVESLAVLAEYDDDGEHALLDPWGQPFHFRYLLEANTDQERLVVWTVVPNTSQVIAAPKQFAHLVESPN